MIINSKFFIVIILFFIILYSFVVTIATDYSWYINRIDWYAYSGIFYDSGFDVFGAWESFMTFLNSKNINIFGNLYIFYWLQGLLYSILSTLVLFKLLKLQYKYEVDIYLGTISYILLAFFTTIYIGARPENIYVSSIVIILYFLYKFIESDKFIWIYFASFISIFGALSHPNGLILFVILFIFAVKLIVFKKFSIIHFILNMLIICSLFYSGLFFGQTHSEFLNFFQNISNNSAHSLPFYYEPKRYISFIFEHLLISPLFLFGLFTLVLYMKKYLLCFKEYFFENFISLSSLFIIVYLIFIGAKWEYYLSLLFPFMVLSIIEYIKDKNFNKHFFIGLGFVLMLIIIGKDFKKNEEFLSILNIPSQRVNIINEVKNTIEDSKVYAPMRLYIMYKYYDRFVPLEKSNIANQKFDFVILDFSSTIKNYEVKLDSDLQYIRSFVYNGHYYNLFKVNDGK